MNAPVTNGPGTPVASQAELDRVISKLYRRLGVLAHNKLKPFSDATLNTSELIHEVYLKLSSNNSVEARDREHFLAIAATAMRQIIIDRARSRKSMRRGGEMKFATLEDNRVPWDDRLDEAIFVDSLMEKLRSIDDKLATTVECRYFAGYSEKETALILGVSIRTVRRYWTRARNWLELSQAQMH